MSEKIVAAYLIVGVVFSIQIALAAGESKEKYSQWILTAAIVFLGLVWPVSLSVVWIIITRMRKREVKS